MKILIYGAGVVGCTYGWLLQSKGHDVTIFVRKEKKDILTEKGIHLICQDYRTKKEYHDVIFRPHVIDELQPNNDFDYIIVSIPKTQVSNVLPILKKGVGKACIVFFQNNWDTFDEIASQLHPAQYFFGFPFMIGGGRNANGIYSFVSGLKYSCTPLGEINGVASKRIEGFFHILEDANLKPYLSKHILVWVMSHYVIAAGLSAGIMCAGSARDFIKDTAIIKTTIKAIREGFSICFKRGFDPRIEKANRLYRLPLFISVPIAKKIFSNEALLKMFDGHIANSPDEIIQMVDDMIEGGEKYMEDTPNFMTLKTRLKQQRCV